MPERRTSALGVPDQVVLLVEGAAVVGDGDDLGRVRDLLLADAGAVSGDPEQWHFGDDRGWEVSVARYGFFVQVVGVDEVVGNELAEGGVVGVDVRLEELGDEVGLLGCRGLDHLDVLLVQFSIFGFNIRGLCACAVVVDGFGGQEAADGLLFRLQSSG